MTVCADNIFCVPAIFLIKIKFFHQLLTYMFISDQFVTFIKTQMIVKHNATKMNNIFIFKVQRSFQIGN